MGRYRVAIETVINNRIDCSLAKSHLVLNLVSTHRCQFIPRLAHPCLHRPTYVSTQTLHWMHITHTVCMPTGREGPGFLEGGRGGAGSSKAWP